MLGHGTALSIFLESGTMAWGYDPAKSQAYVVRKRCWQDRSGRHGHIGMLLFVWELASRGNSSVRCDRLLASKPAQRILFLPLSLTGLIRRPSSTSTSRSQPHAGSLADVTTGRSASPHKPDRRHRAASADSFLSSLSILHFRLTIDLPPSILYFPHSTQTIDF